MIPELPDEVLTELGRLTWSAIHLEALTDAICHNVVHRAREDRTPMKPRVEAALKALRQWPGGVEVDQISEWLNRAKLALERRNALFHSVPMIIFDERPRKVGYALGEMPRGNRPYNERPMEVDDLREVRAELDAAQGNWTDVEMFAYQNHAK